MTAIEIINDALDNGIKLFVEEGRLGFKKYSGGQLTDELKNKIKAKKAEIITYLTEHKNTESQIKPLQHRDGLLTVSFSQQRTWFTEQYAQGSNQHLQLYTYNIQGLFDLDIAEQALTEIISRHEILRSVYQEREGTPYQRILSPQKFHISRFDLSHLNEAMQQAKLHELLTTETHVEFNLAKDVMLRASYISLNDSENSAEQTGVLILCIHHIVSDGWSMEVLLKEFTTLYQSITDKQESPLTPLPIQYADFAAWQRNTMSGQTLDNSLDYWQTQLSDAPVLHSLYMDKARPDVKQYSGRRISSHLPSSVSHALKKIAQNHQLTPFILVHGVLALVISRHSHSHDIVIGAPMAGRQHSELDNLIGFFVNTLVLRVDTEYQQLDDYFEHVRQTHLAAQSNQAVPFDQLVEHLNIPRTTSYSPLFQIILNTRTNYGVSKGQNDRPFESGSLAISATEIVERSLAKFDLDISISLDDDGVHCSWIYDGALFEQHQIALLDKHFGNLLLAISKLDELACSISQLPLLDLDERTTLVNQCNRTAFDKVDNRCLQEVFEQQVAVYGDKTAVICAGERLSYKDLNEKANKLAHFLRNALEVGPDTLVGLCVERELSMLIGMMAIIKAGGAYLPLDPSYPDERLEYMMNDSELDIVLTQQSLTDEIDFDYRQVVVIDSPIYAGMPAENLPRLKQNSSSLAYVIYTSGSTGHPKGVQTLHSGVVRLLDKATFMPLDAQTRFLQAANIAFDAATLEIWGPLLNGGCCILYPGSTVEPEKLQQTLKALSVNSLWLTAGVFDVWSEHCEELPELRWVVTGGDVVKPASVHRVQQSLPNIQVINGYGPTENTTFSCYYPIPTLKGDEKSIPIGHAVSGDVHYVLDSFGQLVSPGMPGELYVSGSGLARGYLNRPRLTEERFVTNPFYDKAQPEQYQRMYKTGDLVRRNSAGAIEFLGRDDSQVKIRGFRIELGEIEQRLVQHNLVSHSVLTTYQQNDQTQLIAYVLPNQDVDKSHFPELLKTWLKQHLPGYMIPNMIMVLSELPLTTNGKINHKALPTPGAVDVKDKYVAPTNNMQKFLCAVWEQALGREAIGIQDNFFDLGGDSISAMRVVYNIKQSGYSLTVQDIFKSQTIFELAKVTCHVLLPQQREDNLFSAPYRMPGNRFWYFDTCTEDVGQWGPAYLLEFTSTKNHSEAARKAANFVVEMHEGTRITISERDGKRSEQIVAFEDYACFEYVDFRSLNEEEIKAEIKALHASINLAQGMVKFWYCDLGEGKQDLLVLVTHHLAIEQYSRDILFTDLLKAFAAFSQDKEPQLKRIGSRFSEWVISMEEWLQGEEAKQLAAYWKNKLVGQSILLPTDYPYVHKRNTVGSASSVCAALSKEYTDSLVKIADQGEYKEFDLILSAVAREVSRWTGEDDFICDVVTSGRDHFTDLDLSGTVGWLNEHISLLLKNNNFSDVMATIEQSKLAINELIEHAKGFSALKYKDQDVIPEHDLSTLIRPDLLINYIPKSLSHTGSAFQSVPDNEDSLRMLEMVPLFGKNRENTYKIYCEVVYSNEQLLFIWEFSTNVFDTETIQQFADNSLQCLHDAIDTTQRKLNCASAQHNM